MAAIDERRLRAYQRLSRSLFPRRYFGKIFMLAFVAAHVPLIALVGYLITVADVDGTQKLAIILVALAATFIGSALTLAGLWVLLTPVAQASQILAGYRTRGTKPAHPVALDGEGGVLLANVHDTIYHLDRLIALLSESASRDELTGVFNRREGERRLREELLARDHAEWSPTLVFLDTDGLKLINDRWGHAAGDVCIRHLTSIVVAHIANSDGWIARWGGDEFIVVLREAEGCPPAETLLEVVMEDLARSAAQLPSGERVHVGFSAGVARATPEDDALTLLQRADKALYRAKRARGMVVTSVAAQAR